MIFVSLFGKFYSHISSKDSTLKRNFEFLKELLLQSLVSTSRWFVGYRFHSLMKFTIQKYKINSNF